MVLIIFLSLGPLYGEQLNSNTLQNDLKYYQKISNQNKLNDNDRYYILLRLQKKYEGSKIDLTPLNNEIKKTQTPQSSKPKEQAGRTGSVNNITVNETPKTSEILISVDNVTRSNYFLLRDPDPKKRPKLIFDLYAADDNIPEGSKDIEIKSGVFSRILSGQFEEKPDKIVRVIADFRNERPYNIKYENNTWLIIAQKDKSEQTETLPAVQVPAVSALVTPGQKTSTQKNQTIPNYRIETGDVLGVTIFPAEELTREVVVQPDGQINLPLVGTLKAKGLTTEQLQTLLTKSFSKYLSNPKVTISVRKFSRRQIFVTGEVHSLGTFDYKENMRLMEFISSLGGFNTDANRSEIKVYRGPSNKKQTFVVNIEEVLKSGDFSKDFLLEPGDIIEVPRGSEKVSLLGDVSSPGYYEYKNNMTLTELISTAHGFGETAGIADIRIIRNESITDESGKPVQIKNVIKVNLKKILSGKADDVVLKTGDTVYIPRLNIVKANWFINNILPWMTLIALVIALGGKV